MIVKKNIRMKLREKIKIKLKEKIVGK